VSTKGLLAFIGPVSYALETRPKTETVHVFRGIAQRDSWVQAEPRIRRIISTTDPRVLEAWDKFTIVPHPDNRIRWNPLV
jgi:hypothetical protein